MHSALQKGEKTSAKPPIAKAEYPSEKKGKSPTKDDGLIHQNTPEMEILTQIPMGNTPSGSQAAPQDLDVNKGTQSSKDTHTSVNPSGTANVDVSQDTPPAPVVMNLPELIPETGNEAASSSNQDWRGSRRTRPAKTKEWKNWSSWNDWEK